MKKKIFVGREKERRLFRQIITELKKKPEERENCPRTFLIHGVGGMGKTCLTNRLLQIAQEILPEIILLSVDWEMEKNQGSMLRPDELLNAIARAVPESNKKFLEPYFNSKKNITQVQAEIDRKLEQQKQLSETVSSATEVVATGASANPLVGKGVSALLLILGKYLTLKQENKLREKYGLSDEKILMYKEPEQALANRLRECLHELSRKQKQPLLLALDTCELIQNYEEWFCNFFLIPLLDTNPEVVLIFSGRENPYTQRPKEIDGKAGEIRGFAEKLKSHAPHSINMQRFSEADIREFLTSMLAESVSEKLVEFVNAFSRGVPYAVDLLANAIQQMGAQGCLEEFQDHEFYRQLQQEIDKEGIIKKIAHRFLLHCLQREENQAELQQIYSMAILNDTNLKLLGRVWQTGQPAEKLQALQSKYAFFTGQGLLHDVIRDFLIDYLYRDQLLREGICRSIVEPALKFYQAQFDTECQAEHNWQERFDEPRWRLAVTRLMNVLTWHDPDQAAQFFVRQSIELLLFNVSIIETLYKSLQKTLELPGLLRNRFRKQVGLLYRAMQNFNWHKIDDADKPKDTAAVLAFCETALSEWELTPLYNNILLLVKARTYYLQKKYDAAWQILAHECDASLFEKSMRYKLAAALDDLGEKLSLAENNIFFFSEKALLAFKKAVGLNERKSVYWYHYGALLGLNKAYTEAINALQRAIELDPKDAYPHQGLGNVYSDLGQQQDAINAYRQAIELDPKYAAPHHGLGNVYSDLGQQQDAINAYRQAIELDPKDAAPHHGLGNAYYQSGQYQDAINAYRQAIELDPKDAYPHYGLGNVYFDLGQYQDAINAYRKAIELDPKDALPQNNLGYLYLTLGEPDKAETCLRQAIELDASDYTARINLGITYYRLNQPTEGKRCFQQALELCTELTPDCQLDKITALLGLGQLAEAQQLLQTTAVKFLLSQAFLNDFFTDWQLLATAAQPAAGIDGFIEEVKNLLTAEL